MESIKHIINDVNKLLSIGTLIIIEGRVQENEFCLTGEPPLERTEQIRNICIEIMLFWNGKGLVKHRHLNDRIKQEVLKKLNEYKPAEIKQTISNYALIVNQPNVYWFKHVWNLWDFLNRGYEQFMIWDVCNKNYRKSDTSNTYTTEGSKYAKLKR